MKWFLSLFRAKRKTRPEVGPKKIDGKKSHHHINVNLNYGNDKDIGYC